MAPNGQAAKPIMTDAAVKAKTGHDWASWFRQLDKAGGKELDHKALVTLVHKLGAGRWWGQMIAVSYERARGTRAVHQKAGGKFSVSVTKVVAASPPQLFAAATDPETRKA